MPLDKQLVQILKAPFSACDAGIGADIFMALFILQPGLRARVHLRDHARQKLLIHGAVTLKGKYLMNRKEAQRNRQAHQNGTYKPWEHKAKRRKPVGRRQKERNGQEVKCVQFILIVSGAFSFVAP